jgi:hypothetical protein
MAASAYSDVISFAAPLTGGPSTEQVRREVWKGTITACITLDPRLLAAGARPPAPCFVELPRQSYPHVHWAPVLERLRAHLRPELAADPAVTAWCEVPAARGLGSGKTAAPVSARADPGTPPASASPSPTSSSTALPPPASASDEDSGGPGIPVRWNLPVGVSFDTLGSPHALPWQLIARFSSNPPLQVLPLGCGTAPGDHSAAARAAGTVAGEGKNALDNGNGGAAETTHSEQPAAPPASSVASPPSATTGAPSAAVLATRDAFMHALKESQVLCLMPFLFFFSHFSSLSHFFKKKIQI